MKNFMGLLTSIYCIPWILLVFTVYQNVCSRLAKAVTLGKSVKTAWGILGEYIIIFWLIANGLAWLNNFCDITSILNVLPVIVKYGNTILFSLIIAGGSSHRLLLVMNEKLNISWEDLFSNIGKMILWLSIMYVATEMFALSAHAIYLAEIELYSNLMADSYEVLADYGTFVMGLTFPIFSLFVAYEWHGMICTNSECKNWEHNSVIEHGEEKNH